jgi:hypothetical protein
MTENQEKRLAEMEEHCRAERLRHPDNKDLVAVMKSMLAWCNIIRNDE